MSSAKRSPGRRSPAGPGRAGPLAADVVDEPVVERVEEHAVDGEVAALGVLLGRGEDDRVGMSAVAYSAVGCGTWRPATVQRLRAEHLDDAEAGPDGDGAAEKALHLFGPGVGGDVVVVRFEAERSDACTQPPAHRAVKPSSRSRRTTSNRELAFAQCACCEWLGRAWQG